jgi:O-antigen/teichoic acid export membrane protein
VNQAVGVVLRVASTMILTRLLAPQAYGLLTTAWAIVETLVLFSDIGILPALVRHARGGELSFLLTGWWINLGRMALISVAVMAAALPMARFYKQPELAPVLLLVGLRPVLMGLRSPGVPLLQREMRFRSLYTLEMVLQVVTVVSVVLLTWLYRSPVSVVMGTLLGVLASAAASYLFIPVRPRWHWDPAAVAELGHFGRQVFINTLAMAVWMNIDRLFGLRLLPPRVMGLYGVAWNLASMLDTLLMRACADIYYTMLIKKEEGPGRQRWHATMSRRIAFWLMPVLALGIVMAPLVVWILYDDRWLGASLILAILMARTMAKMINTFEFQYLLSTAAVWVQTRSYIVAALVQAAIFIPMVRAWGARGMAAAGLISSIALAVSQSVLSRLRTGRGGFVPLAMTLAWIAVGLGAFWLVWA